jgi:hypothetical protein
MKDSFNNDTALSEQILGLVKNAWDTQTKAVTTYFSKYDPDFYQEEVAPGRNRAIYLLGHLVASTDGLFPLFGLGDKRYPELEAIFLAAPDNQANDSATPSLETLKGYWDKLLNTLAGHFSGMSTAQWLERHTRVSAEDFALDPKRNKLNVLISRTIHIGYHMGQLALLKQAEPAK